MSLDAIAARLAAASEGPWEHRRPTWVYIGERRHVAIALTAPVEIALAHSQASADAEFIAHAPRDVEDLLAVAQAARAFLSAWDAGPGLDAPSPRDLRAALGALDA